MAIEKNFDIPLIASMALKEKQIQQNFRPIIAVHKWFARRPGTLFRGLLLSEFGERPLRETYFRSNQFPGRVVADPFMGGGTPLIEANRLGCDVLGFDINPMSAWIVNEEIQHIDLDSYSSAAKELMATLSHQVGDLYSTDCPIFGDENVPVKYFLWVKALPCEKCEGSIDLFRGYLLAENRRHPKNVVVCAHCGGLNEVDDLNRLGKCRHCRYILRGVGPARRNRCICSSCGHVNSFPRPGVGPLAHRLFAIEYHNPRRRHIHEGRFFKKPDRHDLEKVALAYRQYARAEPRHVPSEKIPAGDETDRLHRWGYSAYHELFNHRQLLGLELSCRLIAKLPDERVRNALATNLSDLLRYQNMLCRYDTMALKSLDIFSVHGFPVGLVQCESNLLGISNSAGAVVGSGGWRNIVEKYVKAKRYCDSPFEINHENGRKITVTIDGEWIGDQWNGRPSRSVHIECVNGSRAVVKPNSLDAVFTDPPYFGNVQYSELMDFCYVWLRHLVRIDINGFDRASTRLPEELTGNQTHSRDLAHFAEGLSAIYQNMAAGLKSGAPLAFTFHHNRLEAYWSVVVAILDAGLACSATLPCPAEMSGSIHIHGTGSSIVDSVFVCRAHGVVHRKTLCDSPAELMNLVKEELAQLRLAGLKPTIGDIRCIVYGHLARMAVWTLRKRWDSGAPVREKLERVASAIDAIVEPAAIIGKLARMSQAPSLRVAEERARYVFDEANAVSF